MSYLDDPEEVYDDLEQDLAKAIHDELEEIGMALYWIGKEVQDA